MATWRRTFRSRVPARAKHAIRSAQSAWGRSTSSLRLLPDFLIIGAQRGGTTSLYKYLAEHPSVAAPPLGKGAHFFDTNYSLGEEWYRGHFPTRAIARLSRFGAARITGESSPYYLFHPHAPKRVAEMLPGVKLIAMLRDPVTRAHSHYWHEVARGFESLSFEEAIEREPERLEPELARMRADPDYNSFEHQHHSYLSRGLYADQLAAWYAFFPRESILLVSSEDFFAEPDRVFRRVLEFLGLRVRSLRSYEPFNPREYPAMADEARQRLVAYFAEPNARLAELVGFDSARAGWSLAPANVTNLNEGE